MLILITGAAGHIGQALCGFLAGHGFQLRGFDRRPCDGVHEQVLGDIEDLPALRAAARGADAVVHLAARPDNADFATQLVPANVIGLYNILEAARLEGVGRIILAGSFRAGGLPARREPLAAADRSPEDPYGLTKLWAEDMGRMYAQRYGLSVLVVRLGWVLRNTGELRDMERMPAGRDYFLSHGDLRRFFLAALGAERAATFEVLYAVSHPGATTAFDVAPAARAIGFKPCDTFPDGIDWRSDAP